MSDSTESIRREMVINSHPCSRETLEKLSGQVWDTQELGRDFEVITFAAPFVIVKRLSDGVKGSLEFQHSPRFYYDFTPAK